VKANAVHISYAITNMTDMSCVKDFEYSLKNSFNGKAILALIRNIYATH